MSRPMFCLKSGKPGIAFVLSLALPLISPSLGLAQTTENSNEPAGTEQRMSELLQKAPWRAASVNGQSTRSVFTNNPRLAKLTGHLAAEVRDRDDLRMVNILGRNDVVNLSDLFYLRGVDFTFIRSDTIEYVKRRNEFPGITRVVNAAGRLFEERVVILVKPSIRSIKDLQGKTIAVGLPGSGEHITGSLILELSDIKASTRHVETGQALDELQPGGVDAVVVLLGPDGLLATDSGALSGDKTSSWSRNLARENITVLPLPLSDELASVYSAAELTPQDLPGLLAENESADTLGVQTILAAYRWSPRNSRFQMSSRFVRAFMESQLTLQEGEHAELWAELDFELPIPGISQLSTVRNVFKEREELRLQALAAQQAQETARLEQRMERFKQQQAKVDRLMAERFENADEDEMNQLKKLIAEFELIDEDL